MKWMHRLLLVYSIGSIAWLVAMGSSTLRFDPDVTTPFVLSETAMDYAETRHWDDSIDAVIVEHASTQGWEWIGSGEAGVFTPPSVNPLLFERDWSIRPEITASPDIVIQTHLMESANGALHWIVWFEMPLNEAREETGSNFLHLGYSHEYVVNDVLIRTYYRTDGQTVMVDSDAHYDDETSRFDLPTTNASARLHDVDVVGFLVLSIEDPGDWNWFESSVNLYDGSFEDEKIVIGFNGIRWSSEPYYEVSATWLRIRRERA
jgi:hypothetical protein